MILSIIKHFKVVVALCLSIFVVPTYAADGDVFTANTKEGVPMTFQVVSEADKTCGVYAPSSSEPCIPMSTSGSITIPSMANDYRVVNIGDNGFNNCIGLTSATIPNSVTNIGSSAFYGCTCLTNITISESVINIGSAAFYGCTSLTNIVIPNSVITIEDVAFCECTSLKNVTIGNSVKTIGGGAFSNCTSLISVFLPKTLIDIDDTPFYNCTSLESIAVEEGNPKFDSRNDCNAIIKTESNALIRGCMNTIIPSTVTRIEYEAFYNCYGLTSITIPESVTSIGGCAFCCSGLTSVVIPNSVTSIEDLAFDACSRLTSVTIPESVTDIRRYTFSSCSSLKEVVLGTSVTSIGEFAFYECTSLVNIIIPDAVTYIGKSAFQRCKSLINVVMSNSVTTIESEAFASCISLAKVNLSNSLTSIGYRAFFGCAMNSITIPNSMTSIGPGVFQSCHNLTNVIIPETVKSIGRSAFYYSGLTNVVIPGSVTSIGNRAFCTQSLTSITSEIEEPFDISGEGDVFCTGINATLYVPVGTKTKYESTADWNQIGNIVEVFTAKTEEGVKLTFKAIDEDRRLCQVGNGSSRAVSSATADTITIPNQANGYSVVRMGDNSFSDCPGIRRIMIPNTIIEMGTNVFTGSSDLEEIIIDPTNQVYDSRNNCNAVIETASNQLMAGCKGTVIPQSVTSIASRAFYACSGLESIIIPHSVTSIGDYAFYGCTELTSIFSELEEPFAVSENVFQYSDNDTDKPLPATLYVPFDTKAIYEKTGGWNQLNIVTRQYDDGAVFLAETAEGVEVAYKVTNGQEWLCQFGEGDGKAAFDAVGVRQITIPAQIKGCTVTSIADGAFSGCTSLLSVSFPETITSIDTEALKDCCDLAAILWNAETVFPKEALASAADNPNLLLYVKNKSYAPNTVGNVVVNGTAPDIILKDADHGSNFYCPKAFTTTRIEYEHDYTMETGYGECRGWETIALPFDVTRITHEKGVTLVPLTSDWNPKNSNSRPFWLYEESANGWQSATAIKANTPYLISMPNNDTHYEASYNVNGRVVFVGENVQVQPSQSLNIAQRGDRSFVPNFQHQPAANIIYAMNINDTSNPTFPEGSVFLKGLRGVRPFEAYCVYTGLLTAAPPYIPVFDNSETTGILEPKHTATGEVMTIYNLGGQRVRTTGKGIYIINGKKMVIK